ncbi:MAG: hypothetical protein LBG06_00925, partial [Deltaproteobacteria bacterium]|nr:hypothetical protein [Deltaproteobacteria bacterium]
MKTLGLLATALAVAAGGALVFLRTGAGLDLAVSLANRALAARSLSFTAGRLEGPLPGSLTATDVSVSDAAGVFLRAARLEARISLLALLSRRLEVDLLQAEGLDFIRPPELPPSREEGPDGPASLPPVDVQARVEIRGARILSGRDPVLAGSRLELSADLSLSRERRRLAWEISGRWTGPEGRGVTFASSHDPIGRPADPLSLELRATAGAGSPLSALVSDLPFADPELSVTGSGPPEAWEADFLLSACPLPPPAGSAGGDGGHDAVNVPSAGDASPADAAAPGLAAAGPGGPARSGAGTPAVPPRGEIRGRLVFKGIAGKTFEEILTAPDAPFSLSLEAVQEPYFPVPPPAARWIGKSLRLTSGMDRDEGVLHGNLRLFSEKGALSLGPLTVTLEDGAVRAEGEGSLEVADFREFTAAPGGGGSRENGTPADAVPAPAGLPAAASPPPAAAPPGASCAAGGDPAPSPDGVGDGSPGGVPAADGAGILRPPYVRADLAYSLEFSEGDAHVKSFTMRGDGVDLSLSGDYLAGGGSVAAEGETGGGPPRPGGGGEARASLSLALAPGSGFAGLLSGLLPALTDGAGAEIRAGGSYLTAESELRDVTLLASTRDLSAFLPSLGGDAEIALKASGPLAGAVRAELYLSGERILIASGRGDPDPAELAGPALRADGILADLAGAPSFDGRVELKAKGRLPGDRAFGDASLAGGLSFAAGGGGLSFGARDLALSALGTALEAESLGVRLPSEGPPALSGGFRLSVRNWELPSKLAGLRITGEPLFLEAVLGEGGDSAPRYSLSLRNAGLDVDGAARLSGTELALTASGPLDAPALEATLREGPGQAAGFSWSSGELTARDAGGGSVAAEG